MSRTVGGHWKEPPVGERDSFLSAYRKTLEMADVGRVRISAHPTRRLFVVTITDDLDRRVVHHIQDSVVRQGTACQGAEAALAVLKEFGWPEK